MKRSLATTIGICALLMSCMGVVSIGDSAFASSTSAISGTVEMPTPSTMHLNPQTTALVLVDFLTALAPGTSPVLAAQTLLTNARNSDLLIIHTGIPIPSIGTQWIPSLEPKNHEPVIIGLQDKFHTVGDIMNGHGTGLEQVLHAHHITTLIIAGGTTGQGVANTALEALLQGYQVVIPEDATFASSPFNEAFALDELEKEGSEMKLFGITKQSPVSISTVADIQFSSASEG